jgi:hypothetical protein
VFDKSNRTDGTFSRVDFAFDAERDRYTCPAGNPTLLRPSQKWRHRGRYADLSRRQIAVRHPQTQSAVLLDNTLARKIPRDLHEAARDVARAPTATPQYVEACRRRKKVEMLFARLKRILRLARLRLRGPDGAKDEFSLPPPLKT